MAHKTTWIALLAVSAFIAHRTAAQESIWIEAEHLEGVRGTCWPMGRPDMRRTNGHFGLSGPGWAAEWTQGGESGFLSIAAGADDDRAEVKRGVDVPRDGVYRVFARYADWREAAEPFEITIEQAGREPWKGAYGARPVIEEDNEMKLYWGWAFGWAEREAELAQGPAVVRLATRTKAPRPRQIDLIVLTTDTEYHPRIKDRPHSHAWKVLDPWRAGIPRDLEPLARRRPDWNSAASRELPESWKLETFRDRGFLYLWNVSHTAPLDTWLSDKPNRVRVPYNIADAEVRSEFEAKYAGRDDVPIFSDRRIVPTFHGVGPGVFATDPTTGELGELGKRFSRWLDENPDRPFAMMMNYHPGVPIGEAGIAAFKKYRDRYVGSIAGESLGYFHVDDAAMRGATDAARSRRQLLDAFAPLMLAKNAEKYRAVFGRDIDSNPYEDVISCLSVGNTVGTPICADWGARTIGYESSAATSSVLGMRWAFLRGAARQRGVMTATYRSCNFGDSSTIFSDTQSYHGPKNILDNYYSVFSGAGMTWYKFDIWYQYMAGASMFYHEQGFDEYWKPGGTTAAGVHEVELSPKGKLVDRFLRVTAAEPDRGHPVTPVAILVDHAHGWEPAPFWPNAFKNWHAHPDRFGYGLHEKMLEQVFWTAFHPIGRESERPITGTNEVFVRGVFGDIFDVIFAYPDVPKWRTIDTYPVVIVAGEIELMEAEGARLAQYVDRGGTLLVTESQLSGPGAAALRLPATKAVQTGSGYRWLDAAAPAPSQTYHYHEIDLASEPAGTARPLATTVDGRPFCAAIDRGAGRLIYLGIPRGLGVDASAHPVLPWLIAHLSRDLMPIDVTGEVEWLVNRSADGWLVTLINPAGQDKPQHGITPTDYRENRRVEIVARVPIRSARDRLLPDDSLAVASNTVRLEVPAGGVRIIDVR
ncbi:MAG: hypothetical protein FJ297_18415 [Planctomycetes bacterium]|nr:hypothetical protein [Planctomycetota bacterium]